MDLQRQEYPAMLATLSPNHAIEVLNDRMRQVGSLNAHIADWLQERRKLEEQYSAGLRKLARRPPPGDANELGIFSVPWSTLTNALETLADSHHTLASRIEADVERPLRDFAHSNREMQAMATIQGNLASMARDIEGAQKKNERLASKGAKAKTTNVANASNDLETAQGQWESQAPYVFETLQAVDDARLNQLRDVLTQFQTQQIDQVEKDRTAAEQGLNVLLTVETADEIKTFALRTTQGQTRNSASLHAQPPRSRHSVIGPSIPSLHAPSTPQLGDDAASQRSGSAAPEPEKKSSGIKGLKRLGTVLGRRRESKIMLPAHGGSESPERRPKGPSAFNSFSNRLGRGRDMPTPLEESDEPFERPRSPLRQMTSSSNVPTSPVRENGETPAIDGSAQSLAAAGLAPNGHSDHTAEVAQLQEPLQPQPAYASKEADAPRDSEGFSIPPPAADAISQAQHDAAEAGEGSMPAWNVNIRKAPISDEDSDAALASVQNALKMQAPPPASRRTGTVRGRRDMRASVYGAPASYMPGAPPDRLVEEVGWTPADHESASVSNEGGQPSKTHVAQSKDQVAAAFPPLQTNAAGAMSKEQVDTAFPSVPSKPTSPAAALQSTVPAPASPTFPTPNRSNDAFSPYHGSATAVVANIFRPGSSIGAQAHDDARSIRSGRSLSSTGSMGASRHPEMHNAGINTSIIETVSAWFDNGNCTRSVVIGEVAVAHNPTHSNNPSSHETIRLEGFEKLEKVAPNPAFISDSHEAGEYTVNVAQLHGRTNVAFKYQITPTGNPGAHAPLLLQTAWKIGPGTAMCILSYSLNPSVSLPAGQQSITLSNVTLILHLGNDGAKAQSCQSKPVGTFDRTRNLIYWQLGDVTLTADAAPQKLLAKFVTPDGEAKAGPVEGKWEVTGAGIGSDLAVSVREVDEADPFADSEERNSSEAAAASWKVVDGHRKVLAGTYHAQ